MLSLTHPLICFTFVFSFVGVLNANLIDLTSGNRRAPVDGLPDWSKVGYEQGSKDLPGPSEIKKTISAAQLASNYSVIADDGKDDTQGLQKAIVDNPGTAGAFTLIQLPPGVINISTTVYLSSNYLILRGAGPDPNNGGTVISFTPDANTKYDVLTPNGDQWDQTNMNWAYDASVSKGLGHGNTHVSGTADGGWVWPGRAAFRVETMDIADKFQQIAPTAPDNRKDLFLGSVNYHFRNDTKAKGYMADQTMDIAGAVGTNKIYIDRQNSSWETTVGKDVYVLGPIRAADYDSWQVQNKTFYVNEYIFEDWFTITGSGNDNQGFYIQVDHPLAFNLYSSPTGGGSPDILTGPAGPAKVMPIDGPVHHIGIEDLYLTQPMPNLSVDSAKDNYGNLAPESAMHGIVFRFASHSWIKNIKTFMTGSHPVATEAARYIQIQDSTFDGAWNKGAGGNGYVRGSRVWDSLYYNNTLRNLRHFTFQWSAMRNVATMQNMTNDMNLHGGWESYNLFEQNYVAVSYDHRAGSCTINCGGEGEGPNNENGTWFPIYWSAGAKAAKWSGATGPQNVFFRNTMLKEITKGSPQVAYQPYYADDGSLSANVWQFGWDRKSTKGSTYQHLADDDGSSLLLDWESHEQDHFMDNPNVGINGEIKDGQPSLFFKDISKNPAAADSPASKGGSTDSKPNVASVASLPNSLLICLAIVLVTCLT